MLVPLTAAPADASEQVVCIDQFDKGRLKEVPEYDHRLEGLSPEFEERLLKEYRALATREPALIRPQLLDTTSAPP